MVGVPDASLVCVDVSVALASLAFVLGNAFAACVCVRANSIRDLVLEYGQRTVYMQHGDLLKRSTCISHNIRPHRTRPDHQK